MQNEDIYEFFCVATYNFYFSTDRVITSKRTAQGSEIDTQRKLPSTDTMIHFIPNRILEYKTATFHFLLTRNYQLPYPQEKTRIMQYDTTRCQNTWIPSILTSKLNIEMPIGHHHLYLHSQHYTENMSDLKILGLLIRKLTHLSRNTNLKIRFRSTNTIRKILHTGLTTALQNIKLTFTIRNG